MSQVDYFIVTDVQKWMGSILYVSCGSKSALTVWFFYRYFRAEVEVTIKWR